MLNVILAFGWKKMILGVKLGKLYFDNTAKSLQLLFITIWGDARQSPIVQIYATKLKVSLKKEQMQTKIWPKAEKWTEKTSKTFTIKMNWWIAILHWCLWQTGMNIFQFPWNPVQFHIVFYVYRKAKFACTNFQNSPK